jgi:hypothetical protein
MNPDPSEAIKTELAILGNNLSVLSLANARDSLARHAASMDNHDELNHERCVECETMKLLGRVVKFGNQLREQQ